MKKVLIATVALMGALFADAQALRTPQPSTTQTIKQDFGLGNIELIYSRPNARGRKVMGELVPFGKVWRTGANSATTITFSDDVTIGGTPVKAGKYGLLTIPGAKEWTWIVTKDVNVTSPAAYKPENDVVKISVTPQKAGEKTETFTLQFSNITNTACELQLIWENTRVVLPITTEVDSKVMAQIATAMEKENAPYYAAASYYFDNNKDLNKAKEWIDKAIAANPNAFWMTLLKARIHAKMGDKAGASAMCDKTIELATTAKNDDYIKMATDLKKSLK